MMRKAQWPIAPLRLRIIMLLMPALFLLNGAVASEPAHAQSRSIAAAGSITRGEILARAQVWLAPQIPYNQRAWYQGYREDCSGYVSMAWGLPAPGLTTYTLPTVSHVIAKDDLRPGDILNNQDGGGNPDFAHALIFAGWADNAHTRYNAYEENPYWGGAHYSTGIPYPFWKGYFNSERDYVPRRFNNVSDSATPASTPLPIATSTPLPTPTPPGGLPGGTPPSLPNVRPLRSYTTVAPTCAPLTDYIADVAWATAAHPKCYPDHVTMSAPAAGNTDFDVQDYKSNILSHDFRVSITFRNMTTTGCFRNEIGIDTTSKGFGAYQFIVCGNGSWNVSYVDCRTGICYPVYILGQGTLSSGASHRISTVIIGHAAYFVIDGVVQHSLYLSPTTARRIFYYLDPSQTQSMSVELSNLAIDVLP